MQIWQWTTWGDRRYLTCSLLAPWRHGFFTQQFWPQLPQDLVQVFHPHAQVNRVKQVHGNRVLTPSELQQPLVDGQDDTLHAADGLVSDGNTQSLWVCSADCVPVLIGDRHTGQVAAIHAGWRGTAARIVPQAIARLQSQGSRLADLQVAMGPAIAGEVYQVSKTVAAELGESLTDRPKEDSATASPESIESVLQKLQNLPNPPIYPDEHPERVRIDVRRINQLQLEHLGLEPQQVAIAPHCTYQSPQDFFSYRRTKQKQVQWSGILSAST